MSSGVVVYEAVNGGMDFKINNFNRAAEKIENISRKMAIGRTVCEAFPGVKEFGLFEVLQRVWKTGTPEYFPATFYLDERISGWRENYIARLPSGEVLAVYDDATERKQAELELARQAEELARLYRASGSLLTESPFDLPALARTILKIVLDEFGQANCSLFLVDDDSEETHPDCRRGSVCRPGNQGHIYPGWARAGTKRHPHRHSHQYTGCPDQSCLCFCLGYGQVRADHPA